MLNIPFLAKLTFIKNWITWKEILFNNYKKKKWRDCSWLDDSFKFLYKYMNENMNEIYIWMKIWIRYAYEWKVQVLISLQRTLTNILEANLIKCFQPFLSVQKLRSLNKKNKNVHISFIKNRKSTFTISISWMRTFF